MVEDARRKIDEYALNDAGWELLHELEKHGGLSARHFNHIKPAVRAAIEKYLEKEGARS